MINCHIHRESNECNNADDVLLFVAHTVDIHYSTILLKWYMQTLVGAVTIFKEFIHYLLFIHYFSY